VGGAPGRRPVGSLETAFQRAHLVSKLSEARQHPRLEEYFPGAGLKTVCTPERLAAELKSRGLSAALR